MDYRLYWEILHPLKWKEDNIFGQGFTETVVQNEIQMKGVT